MLYFKGETIPHLSVLTAVQYQHPQQWQDDKASMLIMDSANMVVVLKAQSLQYTATYCEAYLTNEMSPRGSLSIITSASQKSALPVFYVTIGMDL